MLRLLAGLIAALAILGSVGCVVYDPGYHGYRGYHAPRYYYQGPPIYFRFHYNGGWHGMYEYAPMDAVSLADYGDEPPMCVDTDDTGPDNG